jgi:hypothetical protein
MDDKLIAQIRFLRNKKPAVAWVKDVPSFMVCPDNEMPREANIERIYPHEVIDKLIYRIEALEKQNKSMRDAFLWSILHASQLEWNRDLKRQMLEKHFPDTDLNEVAYSDGGVRILPK